MKWLNPEYSAKKRSSTAPSRNTPLPSNAFSSSVIGDLQAARGAAAGALADPPHDRAAVDAAHAADLAFGGARRQVGEQRQHLPQRAAFLPAPRSTSPRWLRLSILISRQVTTPMLAISLRLRICDTTGSRGGVGPATQTRSSDVSSSNRKSAPLCADRQVLGEMPVGTQRAHAEFDGRLPAPFSSAGSSSEMNMSVPV